MLTAVLDRLTTLTSKYFIVGAFVPVLVFGFANGLLLYWEFSWFTKRAAPQISGTVRAFDAAVVFVGLAVVAYLLWSLTPFLRQVLEGMFVRTTSRFGRRLRSRQSRRRTTLRTRYFEARNTASEIARLRPVWRRDLMEAAVRGRKASPGKSTYTGTSGPAVRTLSLLRDQRQKAEAPLLSGLREAVNEFVKVLETNDIVHPSGARTALSRDREELLTLIDYARTEWEALEVALATELQARFGNGAVAPTAFGNVAQSMHSYTLTRYSLNFATFWARLQPVLQKKTELYAMLQDVKLQQDFLVACVWLATVTTVVWVVVLVSTIHLGKLLVLVAVLGPLATWLFYRAAVENYVGFGEIVRTSVDLYRLELLDALHIRRPSGLREERAIWETLQRVVSFGQEWVDISYVREAEPKK